MIFPFKAIGFDWAYTLVDLGKEDDRKPLQKVFSFLSSKNIPLPNFEECLARSRKIFLPMIEDARVTNQEALFETALQKLMNILNVHNTYLCHIYIYIYIYIELLI